MPAVTRELSIVYGSLTTGGSSDYLIDGPYDVTETYEALSARWNVVVASATESGFATACSTVESAMRAINVAFTITLGSETLKSVSHSGNTGFLSRGSARVLEEIQTGRSRRYELSVDVQRPADASGKGGLRVARNRMSRSPSGRMALEVSGTYTATGASAAKAAYDAAIATYVGTVTTALGGTWEKISSEVSWDDENKVAEFSEIHSERLANQGTGSLDVAAIVGSAMDITVESVAPGDGAGADRGSTVVLSYAAGIDRTVTTDLPSYYTGTIRPFLVSQIESSVGPVYAIIRDAPVYDVEENRIGAQITALVQGASSLLSVRETARVAVDYGEVLVPVHDGSQTSRARFKGPQIRRTTVSRDTTSLGGTATVRPSGGSPAGNAGAFGVAGISGQTQDAIASQFGFFGQAGTIGPGNYLGGVEIYNESEGSAAGGGGTSPAASFSAGDILVYSERTETPLVIGLSDRRSSILIASTVSVYEYADPPKLGTRSQAAGGGVGSGRASTVARNG